jgi:hypothetical protein
MSSSTNEGAFGAGKLVLGFDAGCSTCGDVARRIEEGVGDRLEVGSLHHPRVEHWREQGLGKDAPGAPAHFGVGGPHEGRAWTGMVVRLVRVLGPISTWRVIQALGEAGAPKASVSEAPATDVGTAGMSRRQFLKGAGGTALAFGILLGMPSPAQPAQDELNEEVLAETLSLIEDIPDSVAAQGDEAARQWLKRRVQADAQEGAIQPQGVLGCARAIIAAIISNAIPVLKIRKAIRVFGGARNLASFIARTYRRFRRLGNSVGTSIKKTARAVAKRVLEVTGENVLGAVLSLLSLEGVKNECF